MALLKKDCHALFTICHTPLALWLKRFITVCISKLCPEAACSLMPTPHRGGQMSLMETDLGNNLTYFSTDLCLFCWVDERTFFIKQMCLLTVIPQKCFSKTLYWDFRTCWTEYFPSSEKQDRIHSDWCDAD